MGRALVKPTSHTPSTGQVVRRYTDLVTLTGGGRGRNAGIGQSSSIPTLLPLACEQQRGDFSVIKVVVFTNSIFPPKNQLAIASLQ